MLLFFLIFSHPLWVQCCFFFINHFPHSIKTEMLQRSWDNKIGVFGNLQHHWERNIPVLKRLTGNRWRSHGCTWKGSILQRKGLEKVNHFMTRSMGNKYHSQNWKEHSAHLHPIIPPKYADNVEKCMRTKTSWILLIHRPQGNSKSKRILERIALKNHSQ